MIASFIMRTLVIGDVHGCYEELRELLRKVDWNPEASVPDVLVFAGDLVDRGPKSSEVVRFVREAHERYGNLVLSVAGNHDERYPRYAKNLERHRRNPRFTVDMEMDEYKQKVFDSLSDQDIAYLDSLPPYLVFGKWIVVHAGFEPKKSLPNQEFGKMVHIRYVDPITLKTKGLTKDMKQPPGTVYWTELYDLPYNVVYGHMVHSFDKPKFETGPLGQTIVGLDTGSCFGGHLSAYVLETGELFQVKAHKIYVHLKRLANHE